MLRPTESGRIDGSFPTFIYPFVPTLKYQSSNTFRHSLPEKTAVLLVNLGTPDAPDTRSVRRYLRQFLSDPRIIEAPRWLWNLILHGVILRMRPRRSAEAYQSVWSDTSGSPLLSITQQQSDALQACFEDESTPVEVDFAMRYGSPSVESVMTRLADKNVRRLCVLPMYPQYSGTTTASAFDAVSQVLRKTRWLPELRVINEYFSEPSFIDALAASVREHREKHGSGELLVMSYHGIPQRYVNNGDPYFCQCHKTSRLLAEALGLSDSQYRVVFQSRVGREEWLRPYCDETMKALPAEGVKRIDVICPGFSADCLETLEEIQEENKEYFMHAGGESYNYIPCLNDRPDHIQSLATLIKRHMSGWELEGPDSDELAQRAALASGRAQKDGLTLPG